MVRNLFAKGVNALKENDLTQIVQDNPLAVTVGAVAAGGVLAAGTAAVLRTRSSSTRTRKRKSSSRKRSTKKLTKRQKLVRRIKARKGRQTPYTAGARKDRSRTRVRYTKNGQPYTLSGKGGRAKFISKRAAKARRKR